MPYRTKNGRRIKLPRGVTNGTQYLVKIEGTKATFECKAGGHRITQDFSKGPRGRTMSAAALKMFEKYWAKGTGHCYGWCQKCANIADGVAK